MEILKKSEKIINKTASFLKKGGIVVCPTDTVYGFLALASNKKAVDAIFKIKKRPKSKPISIFVKDFKMASEIAFIGQNQEKFIKKRWPGKYTFILKRKYDIKLYGANKNTVGARLPKYKFLNILLEKVNKPLAQTSVNISGKPPLVKIAGIMSEFGKNRNLLIIDGGDLKKAKPSKIIDLTYKNKKVLR